MLVLDAQEHVVHNASVAEMTAAVDVQSLVVQVVQPVALEVV